MQEINTVIRVTNTTNTSTNLIPASVFCYCNFKFTVYSASVVKCMVCQFTGRVPIPISEFYDER